MATKNEWPRRCDLSQCVPSELAIREAINKVEELGADPILTATIVKLNEALDLVGNYVDNSLNT